MRVVAVNMAAQAEGVHAGLALAQAQAMLPRLITRPYDAAADTKILERIADWLDRYTPFVGRTPPDGLMLDITGAAHLMGGEATLIDDVTARLIHQGFAVRAALAGTVGAAWALARYGASGTMIDPGMERETLGPLPVAALRIDAGVAAGLRRSGLKMIGDVMTRPRAPIAARFGKLVLHRLDQALGIDAEAITPRQPIPPAMVEMHLAEPIMRETDVSQATQHLAGQLCALLTERGQGARHVVLTVFRVDGVVRRVEAGLAEPCRDAKVLHGLLALRLNHLQDPLDAGYGFDLVRLMATSVGALGAEAMALPADGLTDAPERDRERQVSRLADRLAARFGRDRVLRVIVNNTYVPEQAATLARIGEQPPTPPIAVPEALTAAGSQFDDLGPLRPLRLFDPPEPVEIIAEVPDGPPLRLRWRRQSLRISAAEGPERVALPWWSAAHTHGDFDTLTRDYYRVSDETGRRLWIFREGLYAQPPDAQLLNSRPLRWFVHGLFA